MQSAWARARIMIVDDEFPNVRILERLLQQTGEFETIATQDPRQAARMILEQSPDLLLLDLHMPHLDGFGVLQQVRQIIPEGTFFPVLILTADATSATKLRALNAGATDFLTKPLDHAEVLLRIRNHVHTRRLHLQLAAHNEKLEEMVQGRTEDLVRTLEELQQVQGQMIQQERLSAFGSMAGGVAHDFNNALSIILGYSEILLAENRRLPPEEREHFVRTIITAAKDSASMISRLREFYRPSDERDSREHVDFAQLANEAISLTKPKWSRRSPRIDVVCDAEPVLPVSGNAAELRELLTNLVFNAVDAMPEGGTITVKVRSQENEQVLVQVTDQGTGMSEEVRTRCLEPFFTTKGERGTGLGLAMVYGIAQRHQATMQLTSEVGRGTTFQFFFPAQQPVLAEAGQEPLETSRPLHILVVDDQPFICEIMEQYLAQDCHTAVTECDPEEALARIKIERFDLLITDQSMPSMMGDQLAVTAKQAAPDLRVILLTGYGSDEQVPGQSAIDLVLAKPVSLETLRKALAEVFSERHAPAAVT